MIFGSVCALAMASCANADCIDDVAAYFNLDGQLVRAIAQHESGMRADAFHRNADGTADIGLMQINTRWLPVLSRAGITPQSLWDPCVNAYVGGWILDTNIRHFGPTWKAVGAYNAVSPEKQLKYANQIYAQWKSIQRQSIQWRNQ